MIRKTEVFIAGNLPPVCTPSAFLLYVHLLPSSCMYTFCLTPVCTPSTLLLYVHLLPYSCTHSFCLENQSLQISKNLGTITPGNGYFKFNIEELCKSVKWAICTLLRKTNKVQAGNIKIHLDLFDRMVLPICTYDGKLWGNSFFTKKFAPTDFLSEFSNSKIRLTDCNTLYLNKFYV